ncbi:MAG: rRNA (cytosine967-C5)-methyltransferase [Candidatus Atribacteria bacterium]|nr:rRNA (cytosine967-C5)-methyltransferase [Candidatus Atribacteria bacterium]
MKQEFIVLKRDILKILDAFYQGKVQRLDQAYNLYLKSSRNRGTDKENLIRLCRGVVKHSLQLDSICRTFLPKWERLPLSIQNLLRLATFQLLFNASTPKSVVVNEAVEISKRLYAGNFSALVNATLRNIAGQVDQHLKILEGGIELPPWLHEQWMNKLGKELENVVKSLALPPVLFLRANTLKVGADQLAHLLSKRDIEAEPLLFPPEALAVKKGDYHELCKTQEYRNGMFYIQDLSSQLVAHLLQPQPGEVVIEVGCGSGGKTTHLAQLMQNQGEIIAIDKQKKLLKQLFKNVQRMGIEIVKPLSRDATSPIPELKETADRVLVDAPCSGCGTIRKNPEVLFRNNQQTLRRLAEVQKQMLCNAANYLKKGGTMVYCVCTLTDEETWEVVEFFEKNVPNLEKVNLEIYLPEGIRKRLRNSERWKVLVENKQKGIEIWPHYFSSDGLFIVAWRKR